MNTEGVGAGGNLEKGLLGGNSGFVSVDGFIEANRLAGLGSEEVLMELPDCKRI